MNVWKAKYQALAAGITDETLISNAEKLVEVSMGLSARSICPFDQVFRSMLIAVGCLRKQPVIKKEDMCGV